jgi:hypothetical protein
MAECGKFSRHVAQIDALAAAMGLTSIGEQADSERAVGI